MSKLSTEELQDNFKHFDRDNDGSIDRAEFFQLMQALDAFESEEDASMGFGAIDLDGSGLVEFDEFARWFSNR